MAKTFERLPEHQDEAHGYDVWSVYEDKKLLGWYFVPENVSGEDYELSLESGKQKLINLGFTEIEAKALMGRQLF